jgi:hypothetical protein
MIAGWVGSNTVRGQVIVSLSKKKNKKQKKQKKKTITNID